MYIQYFKLKEAPYGKDSEYLRVQTRYRKGAGYEVDIAPVGVESRGNYNMISSMFCPEFYQHYCVKAQIIQPALRQSKKQEQSVDAIVKANVKNYIMNYICDAANRGGKLLELTGEVLYDA